MPNYFEALVARCRPAVPIRTAVVFPGDALALTGALAAAGMGLIEPVLVGDRTSMRRIASEHALDIDRYEIVPAPQSRDAAAKAAELARSGQVSMLMKGSLHSDELLHAVTRPESGLHTSRRLSHAYVLDVANGPLVLSDAVVNIQPSLEEKADIVRNAIDVGQAIALGELRVAILSAVETVNAKIPSTVDAAALAMMAQRGEIAGALVDGPLALDDALDPRAAQEKGIASPVAGRANVLIVPEFESGNILAKALIFLAGARAGGIVVGGTVPIVLTSRADDVATHVASAALAAAWCAFKR